MGGSRADVPEVPVDDGSVDGREKVGVAVVVSWSWRTTAGCFPAHRTGLLHQIPDARPRKFDLTIFPYQPDFLIHRRRTPL